MIFNYKKKDFFTSTRFGGEWQSKSDGLSYYFPLVVWLVLGAGFVGFGLWVLLI
jgi:hypothetical protein